MLWYSHQMIRSALVVVCLALGAQAAPAKAPTDDVAVEARKNFETGQKAFKQGKFADALSSFEKAYALKPHPSIRFNQAKCAEATGDAPAALRYYRTYLFEVPDTADREVVEKAITVLERKLAKLNVQQLMVIIDPRDAVISVDGKPLGRSPAFVELGVGDHRVVAELEGLETLSRSFVMSTQKSMELSFVMQPTPPPAPVVTVTPPPMESAPAQPVAVAVARPASGVRVGPLALTVVGGVGLVVGAIFTISAASAWGQLNDQGWRTSHTLAEQQQLARSYSTNVYLGPTLLGVGLAAGVSGLLWWVLGASPTVASWLRPNSAWGLAVHTGANR
jgi:tetratricopeptide (TPR) repeat protein